MHGQQNIKKNTKSVCNEVPLKSLSFGHVCNIYRDKREEDRSYLSEDTVRRTGKKVCSFLKFMEPGTRMKQWPLVSFGSCLSVCLTCGTHMLEFLSRRVKWGKQTAYGEPWRGTGFELPSVSQVLRWASLRPNSPLITGRKPRHCKVIL